MQTLPKVFNSFKNIFCKILLRYFNVKRMLKSGHAMKWNGKWYGMEGEFWYGIWKMLRMEWKVWKIEWKIVFHTSILTTYMQYSS